MEDKDLNWPQKSWTNL